MSEMKEGMKPDDMMAMMSQTQDDGGLLFQDGHPTAPRDAWYVPRYA